MNSSDDNEIFWNELLQGKSITNIKQIVNSTKSHLRTNSVLSLNYLTSKGITYVDIPYHQSSGVPENT